MARSKMSFTVASLRIKRVIRERWGLISWLAIPMIIVFLMSLLAGTGSGKLTGRLLVTDLDDSMVSQFITGGFAQGPLAEIFTTKQVSLDEGKRLMDAGEASAWITIDNGFGEAFLSNEPTDLKLVKNPAQRILPQLVETSMQLLVDAATYIQIVFEKEFNVLKPMLEQQKFNDADLVALTLGIKQQIENLEETIFPPQLKVVEKAVEEVVEDGDGIPLTFGLLMFPGAIFMALIFAGNSLAIAIWDDAKNGVIPRLSAAPSGLNDYFNGQVFGAVAIFTLIVSVLGVLGAWYFALPWAKMPVVILWLVFSGLVIYLLFVTLALMMPSMKVANIIVNATTFPLLMLGGSFFPMESMPDWLAAIGNFLPNGFLLTGLKDWLIRGEGMVVAMTVPLVLGLAMLLVLWLFDRQLIKKLIHKV